MKKLPPTVSYVRERKPMKRGRQESDKDVKCKA